MEDVFEPIYPPRKIEFWLDHFEELQCLVYSPKSSAHIAEHLAREWILLQVRMRTCLCKELHATDSHAVDPACTHTPTGGGGGAYRAGSETALCIMADLRRSADDLPGNWLSARVIWQQQLLDAHTIRMREKQRREPEPPYSRGEAIRRMANILAGLAIAAA